MIKAKLAEDIIGKYKIYYCNVCGLREFEDLITEDGYCQICEAKRKFIRPLIHRILLREGGLRAINEDTLEEEIKDYILNNPLNLN